jgi:hypothetical protein
MNKKQSGTTKSLGRQGMKYGVFYMFYEEQIITKNEKVINHFIEK